MLVINQHRWLSLSCLGLKFGGMKFNDIWEHFFNKTLDNIYTKTNANTNANTKASTSTSAKTSPNAKTSAKGGGKTNLRTFWSNCSLK